MKLRQGITPAPVTPKCRREVANGFQILSKGTKSDTAGFNLQTIALIFHNYARK